MYSFVVLFVVVLTFLKLSIKRSGIETEQEKEFFLVPVFLMLALVMGLRDKTVGIDTINYYYLYNEILTVPWTKILSNFYYGHVEIGYIILNKLCSIIEDDYYFFQMVEAFLYCFLMMRFIKRNADNYILCTVLFVALSYLSAFNIFRQMLAVAFLCNSWDFFKDRKYIETLILATIAISFHLSSYVFIIAYIVYYYRDNKLIMRLSPILMLFLIALFSVAMSYASVYFVKYAGYLENKRSLVEANAIIIVWFIEIIFAIFFIYGKNRAGYQRFVGVMTLCSIVCTYMGATKLNYFDRVGLYFSPFIFLLFDEFSKYIKETYLRIIFYTGVYICYLYLFILSSGSQQYEYKFFFLD